MNDEDRRMQIYDAYQYEPVPGLEKVVFRRQGALSWTAPKGMTVHQMILFLKKLRSPYGTTKVIPQNLWI